MKIDHQYQLIIDKKVEELLSSPITEIEKIEDYGTINTMINNKDVSIGFWKYQISDNLIHIVFKTSRPTLFLGFYKSYIGGVKIVGSKISKLSNSELGDYD